jgi:MaoC like domain
MSVEAVRPQQSRNFDPVDFTIVPPRRFQDLRVGDVFRAPSRTLTDAHAAAFQTVSADNHPIHYDVEYARRHGHIAPVVHGLQIFAFTAPGATLFPQDIGDVFVAFTSASCKFLKEDHRARHVDIREDEPDFRMLFEHTDGRQERDGRTHRSSHSSTSK